MGVSGQRHAPAALCIGERTPGTHCTGGSVGLRASMDTEVRGIILFPCRGSNPDLPVVQSVVRHYTDWATPAPFFTMTRINFSFCPSKCSKATPLPTKDGYQNITFRQMTPRRMHPTAVQSSCLLFSFLLDRLLGAVLFWHRPTPYLECDAVIATVPPSVSAMYYCLQSTQWIFNLT
jgi:hypothetical protein